MRPGEEPWRRDEGTRMGMGILGGCCSRHTTVQLSGGGLVRNLREEDLA